MKRFKKHWFSVAMVLLVITLFTGGIMFKRGGWRVDFDPQCRLHFLRTKPYYKSYRIQWCEGVQLYTDEKGFLRSNHIYKMPTFHHVDIEQMLKDYPVVIPERFKKK
jgi:cytochrome b subunit of formate dehydrogenase